jgi:GAF domain-containing protein
MTRVVGLVSALSAMVCDLSSTWSIGYPHALSVRGDMKDNGLVERLRDAAVTVASGLKLQGVLQNVVDAAATLLDARYAALGVIDEDNRLSEFVHTGFDGDLERVGHPPHGLGILGVVIREGKPLRLRDLSRHPESVGFPDGHPPMRSFLGVPILVRDVAYGRLYITEKRGGDEFTESDEQLAMALAATAGAAVHNALLYGAARLRECSLDAIREISGEILGGSSDDRVLESSPNGPGTWSMPTSR